VAPRAFYFFLRTRRSPTPAAASNSVAGSGIGAVTIGPPPTISCVMALLGQSMIATGSLTPYSSYPEELIAAGTWASR